MKICIDPGHGGESPGAPGRYSLEKNINLEISLRLKAVLKKLGIEVIMTREDDSSLSLQERCDIANNSGCDYFLSIHCNSFNDGSVSGTETYYYEASTEGQAFASAIHSAAAGYIKNKDRGVKGTDFYVLKNTVMPAALLETAFISNVSEEDMLNDIEWQDGFAENLGKAVAAYLGVLEGSIPQEILYRVFHNDVQQGAFQVKDNAMKMVDGILSGIDCGSVKITVSGRK